MKKIFIAMILIVTLSSMVISGCAVSAPETIELKLATWMQPMEVQSKLYEEWADKIAEATNGSVKITIYPGGTLLGLPDMSDGVKEGIADIADLSVNDPSVFPLTSLFTLPFLNLGNVENYYKVWTKLEDEFPEMEAEFKDFKLVGKKVVAQGDINTVKKQIRVPADIKGTKMWAFGLTALALQDMGAVPVEVQWGEIYVAADRGLIEGMVMPVSGVVELGLSKLMLCHTIFPSGIQAALSGVIMNINTWNKLPRNAQKAFDDLSPWFSQKLEQYMTDQKNSALDAIKAEGNHIVIELTENDMKDWFDEAASSREKYLNEVEARGLPVRAVYNEMLKMAE